MNMKGIIKADQYVIPERPTFLPMQNSHIITDVEAKVKYLLATYENEARRLKTEIPKDDALSVIDAYNKGRLYEKESFVDDLKLILDEKNQLW